MILTAILVIAATAAIIVYFLNKWHFNYWKKRGIPGPDPTFIIGNFGDTILGKRSMDDVMTEIYETYKDDPVVGLFKSTQPILLIKDPELIKSVTVRDFSSFVDNDINIDKEVNPLFGHNLFCLKGDEWRTSRAQISPCFTIGKMKAIFPIILEVSNRLQNYITKQIGSENLATFELKELCTLFTLDNVAACAFGLDSKCFEDPNSKFKSIASRFLTPGSFQIFKNILADIFPLVSKYLKIRFVRKDVEDELIELVSSTLKYRKENNIKRNDFLDFLGHLKETDESFTDVHVTAQAAGFFGDGYETSSAVMSFILFNIAHHPEVQEKVLDEIKRILSKENGVLTYEAVSNETPYLDAVISESMRYYPTFGLLRKVCTKKYRYECQNDDFKKVSLTIEPGIPLTLPLKALSSDERYFEEPSKFNPDRFMGERANLYNYVHMPFGEGPRGCIGKKFGLLQVKTAVVECVKNFELKVNSKTKCPLTFHPVQVALTPIGGLWVDFYPRRT